MFPPNVVIDKFGQSKIALNDIAGTIQTDHWEKVGIQ
jgi:hypothetical protein